MLSAKVFLLTTEFLAFYIVGCDATSSFLWPLLKKLVEEKLLEGSQEDVFSSPLRAPGYPSKSSVWGLLLNTLHLKSRHVRVLLLVPQNSQMSPGSEVVADSRGMVFNRVVTLLSICSAQLNLFGDQDDSFDQLIRHFEDVFDLNSLAVRHGTPLGEIVIWHGVAYEDNMLSTLRSSWMGDVGNSEQAIGRLKACFKKVGRRGPRVKDSMDASPVLNLDAFHEEELCDLVLDRVPSTFGSIANKAQMSEFLDQVLEERTVREVLQLREMVNGKARFSLEITRTIFDIGTNYQVFARTYICADAKDESFTNQLGP